MTFETDDAIRLYSEQTRTMTPRDRHEALTLMLDRDRASAWEIAQYERAQRDEYTSKIRFGLTALNAASLVTVINGPSIIKDLPFAVLLISTAIFLGGTALAGYSLISHQNRLIELVGHTYARATSLDRAVALAAHPIGSQENDALGKAIDDAHAHHSKTFALSETAISCQAWSAGAWLGGAFFLAAAKAAMSVPWYSAPHLWSKLAAGIAF